jgi:hypothetical protein
MSASQLSRSLHSFEEYFWLMEQAKTTAPVILFELSGRLELACLARSLALVQQRYPLLRGRISKKPGERPRFEVPVEEMIPLREQTICNLLDVESEILKEMHLGFRSGAEPLARVTLLQHAERSSILLSAHHAAFDGCTMMMIMEDLLTAASGGVLDDAFDDLPGISEVLSLPPPAPYARTSSVEEGDVETDQSEVFLERLHLTEALTRSILDGCKSHGAGVTATLATALAEAGRRLEASWRNRDLSCASPVNLRQLLRISPQPGLLIGPAFCKIPDDPACGFWEVAKANADSFRAMRDLERQRSHTLGLDAAFEIEKQALDFARDWSRSGRTPDIMINNYAKTPTKFTFGRLSIISASSASHAGGLQKVSAITINGSLSLTLCTSKQIPGLLVETRKVLETATC